MGLAGLLLALVAASCTTGEDPTGDASPEATTPSTPVAASETDVDAPDTNDLRLEAVSTRAEYVTGDGVVLAVQGSDGDVTVAVNGEEHTSVTVDTFHAAGPPADLAGAVLLNVTGLETGAQTVTATSGGETAALDLEVHSDRGPLFSGPQQEPFICTAEDYGLVEPDDDCHAEPVHSRRYLTPESEWVDVRDDEEIPEADVSIGGSGDPVIVDLEVGTINRAVYELAVPQTWNGILVYRFGGGCGTGYSQGTFLGSAPRESTDLLAAGYAIASSTLNTFQTACNDVLSAETLMMVKEHFVETVGLPRWTIGQGGSGGAIQQYLIAQNYPGLLDALNPLASFPDAITIAPGVVDCGLLAAFWETDAGSSFGDDQRLAVQGHGSLGFCSAWGTTFLPAIDPSAGCAAVVPPELLYDPEDNPSGARCTLQDSAINLFGADENGFGRRPLDNIGVEYGREALQSGIISVQQFLDLNEGIGGYDDDGNIVAERMEADVDLVETAYRTGRVLHGDSAVADVPIIDVDLYSDESFDIHDRFRLFSIRDRMEGPDAPTEDRTRAIWTRPGGGLANLVRAPLPTVEIVGILVDWLEATTDGSTVAEARPDEATDNCETDEGLEVGDSIYDGSNPCTEAYPMHGDPRTAAGAPRSDDIIKCNPRAADVEGYGVAFTESQAQRLAEIFPDGVCDWGVLGLGFRDLGGTWLSYPEAAEDS